MFAVSTGGLTGERSKVVWVNPEPGQGKGLVCMSLITNMYCMCQLMDVSV